jgi:hypothetical protein
MQARCHGGWMAEEAEEQNLCSDSLLFLFVRPVLKPLFESDCQHLCSMSDLTNARNAHPQRL